MNRDKYDYLKEKASQWRDKALDYQRRYEDILEENERLISELDDIQDRFILHPDNNREKELEYENEQLRIEVEEFKIKYRDVRKKLRVFEKEKEEEILLEKLSKRFESRNNI